MHHIPEWIPLIVSGFNLVTAVIRLITVRLKRRGAAPAPESDGTSPPEPESSTGREGR
ncbi:hypothetical protein [Streptosporangium sp. NPDC002721]|uniref:hypothetical protein n=1 Tax=Streptosporangium sp. NPDC002721 TaxID=3366188 RepID=UPI00367CD410